MKNHLTPEQFRLYDLIWRRMVASQMNDAVFDATRVDIDAESVVSGTHYDFRATGSVLKFAGFRKVYMEGTDSSNGKPSEESRDLPPLEDGDALDFIALTPEQHFTQPPPRYTEATLIRTLEEEGIGRPSTYAPTLATVLDRDYARKAKGRFEPTKLGRAVTGLLIQHFSRVVDIGFTAKVEEQLDEIASGQRAWNPMLKEFYQPFNTTVQEALEKAERVPRQRDRRRERRGLRKVRQPNGHQVGTVRTVSFVQRVPQLPELQAADGESRSGVSERRRRHRRATTARQGWQESSTAAPTTRTATSRSTASRWNSPARSAAACLSNRDASAASAGIAITEARSRKLSIPENWSRCKTHQKVNSPHVGARSVAPLRLCGDGRQLGGN